MNRNDEKSPLWALYDRMIEEIPEGIAITDYALGAKWSYVNSEAGMGTAWSASGGATRGRESSLSGMDLKEAAKLSKSWCFEEATLGIAALNAWHSHPERLAKSGLTVTIEENSQIENARSLGTKLEAFDLYRPEIEALDDPLVVVVGHFPNADAIAEYARLTVLERRCRDELDTPDPACEYVLPHADFAFMTGVTLINKTAPHLLELAKDARVIMVGPSVVMAPSLFDWGVEALSGSVVTDPELAAFAVKNGAGRFFGKALQMCIATKE